MCIKLICGTVGSIATNIIVGAWGIIMLVLGIIFITNPALLFTQIKNQLSDQIGNKLPGVEVVPNVDPILSPQKAFSSQAAVLIVFGILLIAVSIFGFCCGQCGNLCRLVYSIGLAALILIILILLIVLSTPIGSKILKENINKGLDDSFKKYLKKSERVKGNNIVTPDDKQAKAWFEYQSLKQCCGVEGNFKELKTGNIQMPPSCCQLTEQGKIPNTIDKYSNLQTCQSDRVKYANILGCGEVFFGTMALAPQYLTILLIIALFLVICSFSFAVFLLGD